MIETLKQYWLVAVLLAAAPTVYFIFKLFLDFHKFREILDKRKKVRQAVALHYCGPHWETIISGPKGKQLASSEVHVKLYNPESVVIRARVLQLDAKFRGKASSLRADNITEYLVSANMMSCNIRSNPIIYPSDTPMPPRGYLDFLIQYGRDNGQDTRFDRTLRIGGTLDQFEIRGGLEARYEPYPDVEPPTYPDPGTLTMDDSGIHRS